MQGIRVARPAYRSTNAGRKGAKSHHVPGSDRGEALKDTSYRALIARVRWELAALVCTGRMVARKLLVALALAAAAWVPRFLPVAIRPRSRTAHVQFGMARRRVVMLDTVYLAGTARTSLPEVERGTGRNAPHWVPSCLTGRRGPGFPPVPKVGTPAEVFLAGVETCLSIPQAF